ncbi:MAG: dihydrofolate reductase, partial [Mesorhizobium sp.]
MSKLRVDAFTVSIDGFGAGPDQDLKEPLGVGGEALHTWMFGTRTFRNMSGEDSGTTDTDDGFV